MKTAEPTPPAGPALLDLSAGLAARRIARGFLDEARAAAARLDDPDDAEALHDFRVAIRRLRATLRAWSGALRPELTRRHQRALRRVQQATGDGRDAEVMLDWIRAQAAVMPADARPGHARLIERLTARKNKAYAKARSDVRHAFAGVDRKLRRRLATWTQVIDVEAPVEPPTYAAALADALVAHVRILDEALREAAADDDNERLHAARIDAKRLRYLVEPVRDAAEGAAGLVRQCKQLQDVLGELQDAAVLAGELGGKLGRKVGRELDADRDADRDAENEAAAPAAATTLTALTALNTARTDRLLADVHTHWIGGALAALVASVEAFAQTLRTRGDGGAPVEIERKYLLTALPPHVSKAGERAEIDQGYLPGELLIERIRRIRTAGGERYVRTVKAGRGVRRTEIEEACDASVFAALWPLTEGRRVTKIRHAIADGERLWEIDSFTDRKLFLAEIELPHEDTEVVFPAWLAPYIARDVTEEGDYTNRRLAR